MSPRERIESALRILEDSPDSCAWERSFLGEVLREGADARGDTWASACSIADNILATEH